MLCSVLVASTDPSNLQNWLYSKRSKQKSVSSHPQKQQKKSHFVSFCLLDDVPESIRGIVNMTLPLETNRAHPLVSSGLVSLTVASVNSNSIHSRFWTTTTTTSNQSRIQAFDTVTPSRQFVLLVKTLQLPCSVPCLGLSPAMYVSPNTR